MIINKAKKKNNDKLDELIVKFNLSKEEKKEFLKIIYPIYKHKEFQKRMGNEFCHHGKVTLGVHIIEDAIQTYIYAKKYMKKNNNINFELDIAVEIAMLHDLYTVPWQNNDGKKVSVFFNKHGFRHPIEAVINAYNWFPELFMNAGNARKIIDGIIHHMYPLPVRVFIDNDNELELANFDLVAKLPNYIKNILISSTHRNKVGGVSISKSIYLEGRIMSKADKYISSRQIKNIDSAMALITGYNKSLD